jgi:hypothetical protein
MARAVEPSLTFMANPKSVVPASPKPSAAPAKAHQKAFSIVYRNGGWCLATFVIEDGELVDTEYGQPNLLAITLAKARNALVDTKGER